MFYGHVIKSNNSGPIFMIICVILQIQMLFIPRLFVLGDHSVLTGQDKHIKMYVQTSIMIGRQILIRGWMTEGVPSLQEWAVEMARVAAFKKMSYKRISGRGR